MILLEVFIFYNMHKYIINYNQMYCLTPFLETAVNIGYSCRLLSDEMELLILDGSTQDQVEIQLNKCNDLILGLSEQQTSGRNSMTTSIVRF